MKNLVQRVVNLITTEEDKKFEQVARMADAIIDVRLRRDICLPQDLEAQKFTSQDIAAHWHFADALADVELKNMARKQRGPLEREALYA